MARATRTDVPAVASGEPAPRLRVTMEPAQLGGSYAEDGALAHRTLDAPVTKAETPAAEE